MFSVFVELSNFQRGLRDFVALNLLLPIEYTQDKIQSNNMNIRSFHTRATFG